MLRYVFSGTEEDQAEQHDQGTIDEVLEDQDVEGGGDALEEADRDVPDLGFVFLAVLALRSDDYIETCDIYRKKHSCTC